MENEPKDWKAIAKQRRKEIYQKMKASRKAYMERPDVKERMQIAKAKMRNNRRAFMKKLRTQQAIKRAEKITLKRDNHVLLKTFSESCL